MTSQTKPYTDRLLTILQEELDLVDSLFQFAGEKETLLTASDMDGLKGVLLQEEEVAGMAALRSSSR